MGVQTSKKEINNDYNISVDHNETSEYEDIIFIKNVIQMLFGVVITIYFTLMLKNSSIKLKKILS